VLTERVAADRDILSPSFSGGTYTFAHALRRDEVATGTWTMRRQRLHLSAAGRGHRGRWE